MIRSMIKKALGLEARADGAPPSSPSGGLARPASAAGAHQPATGSGGLVQLGRKPGAAPREGLPQRASDADVTTWLEGVVKANPVLIFMKGTPSAPACGFSARVVDIFQQTGVPFQTYNILEDGAVREGIKAWNNWPTIPQVFIGGEFVGGCDIVTEMARNGELSTALARLSPPAQG